MSTILNRFLFGFVLVAATLSLSCASLAQTSFPAPQSAPKSALDKEAEQQAVSFLKRTYYKCGDSYFKLLNSRPRIEYRIQVPPDPFYLEMKGFAWKLEGPILHPPLTESELLNGVTRPDWEGKIQVVPRVFREYMMWGGNRVKKWKPWKDNPPLIIGTGLRPLDTFPLSKKNGKWAVFNNFGGGPIEAGGDPVDCNAIPQAQVTQVPDPKPTQIKDPAKPVATVVADPLLVPPDARVLPHEDQKAKDTTSSSGSGRDYNRVFSGKEVDQKARVLSKPEPQYTEEARKNQISGTVVLRAVFTSSGEVTNITARAGLPYGLTERAIAAAKQIKFVPATKDGRPVSMYIQLEYNFNPE